MKKPDQADEAMDTLRAVQSLMGQLDFTMTADGSYYKNYGIGDDSVMQLVPVFDKGISLDVSYKLVGFNMVTSRRVHIVEGLPAPVESFPIECVDDVKSIVQSLAPGSRTQLTETYMVTAVCSMCDNEVSSYVQQSGQFTCLKCMGMVDTDQDQA